jgi:MFS family permease
MFCMLLLEIPTGVVADYFGRKCSIQLGLIFQTLGFVIYVSMPNFYIYMLGEAMVAIGFSLVSGADEAFIYDTLKSFNKESESKKIFGRVESTGFAGAMIAAPLGSFLAQKLGLQYPMLFMFIPLCLALITISLLKEPAFEEANRKKESYTSIMKNGIQFFYKHKILRILASDVIVITTTGFLMLWLYQFMLKQAGMSILFFGLVNTFIFIVEIILINNYIRLEKLLRSKRRVISLSAVLIGVMLIVGGLTDFLPVVIIVILTVCGFAMTRRTLMVNYMNKYIPSEKRATVISSVSMLISIGKMISFPLVGIIIEKLSLDWALIILGSLTLIFAFISKVEEKHLID